MIEILSLERIEAQALRGQQIAFCVITTFVIAVLLVLHTLFAALLGEPSYKVILLLGLSFSAKVLESLWLQGKRDGISEKTARIESVISIVSIFALAGFLAFLTDRDDAPYFVLLAIPILQSAYQFGWLTTLLTIGGAISVIFTWIFHFFALHPPQRPTEFLESGMISIIFALMGMLVWNLVNQVKHKQAKLYEKVIELQSARNRLVAEEKLAAVGRLAGAVAHEIRNPVAIIASALETAADPASVRDEREEMYAIVIREAKRLENLTTDFLTYARPSRPQRAQTSIPDLMRHIADVTKMRAAERSIEVKYKLEDDISVEVDVAQVEGAILNLCLNAIDATPERGVIELREHLEGNTLQLNVTNSGKMISDEDLTRVFEPFFTTKPNGTGLGLAIARGVALAHGGDLWISENQNGAVTFSMTLLKSPTNAPGVPANG